MMGVVPSVASGTSVTAGVGVDVAFVGGVVVHPAATSIATARTARSAGGRDGRYTRILYTLDTAIHKDYYPFI
jgi:hypothetical protein